VLYHSDLYAYPRPLIAYTKSILVRSRKRFIAALFLPLSPQATLRINWRIFPGTRTSLHQPVQSAYRFLFSFTLSCFRMINYEGYRSLQGILDQLRNKALHARLSVNQLLSLSQKAIQVVETWDHTASNAAVRELKSDTLYHLKLSRRLVNHYFQAFEAIDTDPMDWPELIKINQTALEKFLQKAVSPALKELA
jgi:hypothetical protein